MSNLNFERYEFTDEADVTHNVEAAEVTEALDANVVGHGQMTLNSGYLVRTGNDDVLDHVQDLDGWEKVSDTSEESGVSNETEESDVSNETTAVTQGSDADVYRGLGSDNAVDENGDGASESRSTL